MIASRIIPRPQLRLRFGAASAGLAALVAGPALAQAQAQAATAGNEDLAKQLSNPVASLISLPFQENLDFGVRSTPIGNEGVKSTLNIQPVVPLAISQDWNLILRTIVPVIQQNDVSASGSSEGGLGDVLQSFFFSPRATGPGGIIWGAGPAVLYPTATDHDLGGGKWGVGPTFVVLKQSGPVTYGILANHIWSVAGPHSRANVSSTFLQPFYSYTTKGATSFTLNTETSYDWERDKWTVPINFLVAQLLKVGTQPVQVGVGARYYAQTPAGGPEWGLRMVVTLLYPK